MLISVIIPVKNGAATIGRTIASLRDQTAANFEAILVDGGSTDDTLQIVDACKLQQCRIIADRGCGITAAVNQGISEAKGDAIMPWLCADDYLDPQFIEAVSHSFNSDNPDFVYGNWHVVERGRVIKSRKPEKKWELKLQYYMPLILPNTCVFKASLLKQVGPLDESLKYSNDYDLLRRIHDARGRGKYCADAWYYFQTGGISQARHFECLREIAMSAVKHGSKRVPTLWYFAARYLVTKGSFLLNRFRTPA
jgi:glycosyltransferase